MRVGLEDGVGGIDGGVGDGEIDGLWRSVADDQGEDNAEKQKRYKYRCQEVAVERVVQILGRSLD